ncbi:MAG TPA: GTP diphosphokinase, partial [Cobetia sp.]|nr:GTP diphosphokinase [Cobetia sp.]
MVKVREDQPLTDSGGVDIPVWVARLREEVPSVNAEVMVQACEVALKVAREADARGDKPWREPLRSFRFSLEMADILSELKLDQPALVAAVLYRAVREGHLGLEAIEKHFGKEVARLIDGVLNMAAISQLQAPSHGMAQHDQQDNLRKMLVSMIDDVRIALIKIAERTVALRHVKDAPREKRMRVASEVFDIYGPLAHRLGIGQLKWELEDLSFRYREEDEYKTIAKQLSEKRLEREHYIADLLVEMRTLMSEQGIKHFDVAGRAKHIYSIWRKMKIKRIAFSQVYDVRAVRILVGTV